ncbi:hypothetical protein AURDEDRAFT_169246 [Auricularia subglabra TFB-10046 SS5]|nr:hypothetical protein AURDEDRAFT_169246 [Auricularia subglabra TFB-10046 SS5]
MLPRAQRLAIWMGNSGVLRRSSLVTHLHAATPVLRRLSVRTFFNETPVRYQTLPLALFRRAPLLAEVSLFNTSLLWVLGGLSYGVSLSSELPNPTATLTIALAILACYPWPPCRIVERLELKTVWCLSNFLTAFVENHAPIRLRGVSDIYHHHPPWWRQAGSISSRTGVPNLDRLTFQVLYTPPSLATDILAHTPHLRELHFVESTMTPRFFSAAQEHVPPSLEELSFRECKFSSNATSAAFTRFLAEACLPPAATSSSVSASRAALKRLRIAQIPKTADTLPTRVVDRIRTIAPFFEVEEIQDF